MSNSSHSPHGRRRIWRFGLLAVALCLFLPSIQPRAASASDADGAAVVAVIQTQLEAFRAGDHATAYDQAAPSIRSIFPSVDHFMRMVRSGYGALIDPASVDFTVFEARDDRAVQEVVVQDRQGRAWKAFYLMERQSDGSWRIAGVQLAEMDGESA